MHNIPVRLIVGLGNPGPEYASTRHNVGAWLVDLLARQHHVSLKYEKKFHGHVGKIKHDGHEVWLLIPTTYMNHSGKAIQALAQFYKIPTEAILVAHDELDFPPGMVRLKQDGGHGGHNGLRDAIHHIGKAFLRLRIGIGHPGNKNAVHHYVLTKPNSQQTNLLLQAIEQGIMVLPYLIAGDIQRGFKQLHDE